VLLKAVGATSTSSDGFTVTDAAERRSSATIKVGCPE